MPTRLMIDRIRVKGPLPHKAIGEAVQMKDKKQPGKLKHFRNRKPLKGGKLLATVNVRSKEVHGNKAAEIEFDCCPPKVLQGHNLFGSSDLLGLVYDTLLAIIEHAELAVDDAALQPWQEGNVTITEIHITGNFRVEERLLPMLIEAIDQHVEAGKCRPYATSITLGGKSDKRSMNDSLLVYSKLRQVERKLARFPKKYAKHLRDFAKDTLRVEAKLYLKGLASHGRSALADWQEGDLDRFFWEIVDKYELPSSIQPMLTADEEQELSKREQVMYLLWLHGHRPLDYCKSRTTFMKYRNGIKDKVGSDIESRRRPQKLPEVTLKEILVPDNLKEIPDWAYNTVYFHEPSARDDAEAREFAKEFRKSRAKG